jgi:hypothetical protein
MRTSATLKDHILRITVTGESDLEESVRVFTMMCRDAAAKKARGIMMDVRGLTGALTAQERFEMGSRVAACAAELGGVPKVAVVGLPPAVDGFAAMVARNRGVTVDIFQAPVEALEWLKK